jgi:hypothetical protein
MYIGDRPVFRCILPNSMANTYKEYRYRSPRSFAAIITAALLVGFPSLAIGLTLSTKSSARGALGSLGILLIGMSLFALLIKYLSYSVRYRVDSSGALSVSYTYGLKWHKPVLPEEVVFVYDVSLGRYGGNITRLLYKGESGAKIGYTPPYIYKNFPEKIKSNKESYRAITVSHNFIRYNKEFANAYAEYVSKIALDHANNAQSIA